MNDIYCNNFNHQDVQRLNIALVCTRLNQDTLEVCLRSCRDELLRFGALTKKIFDFSVPTITELPFTVQNLASLKNVDVVLVLGTRTKAENNNLSATDIEKMLLKIALNFNIPVVSSLIDTKALTDQDKLRALGQGLAQTALEMSTKIEHIQSCIEPLINE